MEGGGQFQDTRVKCTSWKPESSQVTQPFVNEAPKATAAVIRNQSADCSHEGTTCVWYRWKDVVNFYDVCM